ncbi:MAG TPA: hypothetical protein VG937_34375 [Polyangiaceae bacterium]|jgi:hypothetical protein|nr:hypothetical protein [Polyangiaceae bacterium]
MSAWQLGARLTTERLRSERTPLLLLACVLLAALLAYVERRAGGSGALERALERDCFGILLPLVGYVTFQRATEGGRLDNTVRTVARHGISGRAVWLGAALAPTALLALLGMTFAATTVCCARGVSSAGLASELWQSSGIGAFAGAAYGAWLSASSDLGRFGSGRKWMLLVDLLLGSGSGSLALPWPRAHIQNLLGAEPVSGLGQGTAFAVLLTSAFTVLLVAVRRAPD